VNITAGNTYQQTASNVVAPEGDVDITAKEININAAQDSMASTSESKFKQSGITVGLNNAVIDTAQSANQVIKAAENVKDGGMKVLAAGALILQGYNLNNSLKDKDGNFDKDKATGVSVSISVGSTKFANKTEQTATTTVGSTVSAGNNIQITASENNATITGANIVAGNNATISAAKEVILEAAQGGATQKSTNSNSSASLGLSIGLGKQTGLALNVGISGGRGNADGSDVINTNTHVIAGNQVNINSGTDTTIKGAVVSGKEVIANVGNNLNIESVQDTSHYASQQRNVGVNASIPLTGGKGSFGVSAGKSNVTSTYASVVEQSGIRAGDEGFKINVTGNTDLKGGVIASTDKAVTENKNTFTTAALSTSDLLSRPPAASKKTNCLKSIFLMKRNIF
jgi:filamentous hemagglutinin